MKNFDVKITEVHLVSPASPTEKHRIPITTFDLMQKREAMPYLQRIAFYDAADDDDDLVTKLKNSLAQVLVHYYPFAGRICFPAGRRPEIDCNDCGVELSVAVADASLTELDLSQYSPAFKQLIQRGNYEETTMTGNAPFLAVQVTKFRCGALSVAWSFDHLIVDGIAMMQFMTAWAELNRGRQQKQISVQPNHDRDFEKQNKQLVPEIDNVAAAEFKYEFVDHATNVQSKILTFDEEHVRKMKLLVESEEHGPFTTYEAIAAHFWVVLTQVRKLEKSQRTRAQIAVNCRHKLDPPLPLGYFGNAVLPGVAESTAGELESGGRLAAAILLKNAIRRFGMDEIIEQFKSYNDNYLSKNPMSQGVADGLDIFFGSSLRHPLYEIDFGWGKPAAVRHGRFLWDGFCFFDPSPNGGKNMDINIHLPPAIMQAFEDRIYTSLNH